MSYAEFIFPVKPYPSVKGMELVIREVANQNRAAGKVTLTVSSISVLSSVWTAAVSSISSTAGNP